MRRTIAPQIALAVLLAFFGAPFLHLHTAEVDDHHHHNRDALGSAAIVHAHFPGAPAGRGSSRVSQAEEHEFFLNAFAVLLKPPMLLDLPFLIAARVEAEPPAARVAQVVLQFTPRTHGPPVLESVSPRAPPA
jgi:hypothetical protein